MSAPASKLATLEIAPRTPAAETRAWIKAASEELRRRYLQRPDPARTLAAHAAFVDQALQKLWKENISDPAIALVAVGGYGRGALFPHSDVDVLVLLPDGRRPDATVERFIGALWDSGLEPGHSVRTLAESVEEAAKDVTVDTS
ncbi:MAG TPA: nucleotidyltransferase domain-containing protein, partial [Usitatibacter sp.]